MLCVIYSLLILRGSDMCTLLEVHEVVDMSNIGLQVI